MSESVRTQSRHVTVALHGSLPKAGYSPPPESYVICADGAAMGLLARGIVPAELVGDLDSITPEALAAIKGAGSIITSYSADKDETDGELALAAAIRRNPTELDILGLDGGRFDMACANLALLLNPKLDHIRLVCHLADGSQALLVTPSTPAEEALNPGQTVSVLPLSDEVMVSELRGVKWSLAATKIYRSSTRTISNTALGGEPVVLTISSGRALLVYSL